MEKQLQQERPPSKGTTLLHYTPDGNYQLNCTAKVISKCLWVNHAIVPPSMTSGGTLEEKKMKEEAETIQIEERQHVIILLDVTCMHPQGGGQPCDYGTIGNDKFRVSVEKVLLDPETFMVSHYGILQAGSLVDIWEGSTVHVTVDPIRRSILSQCHSAGHAIDAAIGKCYPSLVATKGYHYLDGPYVEYQGTIPPEERETVLQTIQQAFQGIISQCIPTTIQLVDQQQSAHVELTSQPNTIVRVVSVAGLPCPCGGTHVRNTNELSGWEILGLKCKKNTVRIRYGLKKESK